MYKCLPLNDASTEFRAFSFVICFLFYFNNRSNYARLLSARPPPAKHLKIDRLNVGKRFVYKRTIGERKTTRYSHELPEDYD